MTTGEAVSLRVVERVAEREGVDPVDLRPPLHDVVDPEALDELIRSASPDGDVSVTFVYRGHEIRVDGTGLVRLSEPDCEAEPDSRCSRELSGD